MVGMFDSPAGVCWVSFQQLLERSDTVPEEMTFMNGGLHGWRWWRWTKARRASQVAMDQEPESKRIIGSPVVKPNGAQDADAVPRITLTRPITRWCAGRALSFDIESFGIYY